MCPPIQGLPERLHGRPGGAEEFLRLSFGLRKPTLALAPRDPLVWLQDGSQHHQQAVKLVLEGGAEEGRQQGLLHSQRSGPFVPPPSPLQTLGG